METDMIPARYPDLIAHMRAITERRGISREQFTPAVCGEVAREAIAAMDKTAMEVIERRADRAEEMRRDMARLIYLDVIARRVP